MINNTQYLTGGKSPNPLSPPTNLAAKAGNAQVTLTWTDPPNATSEPSGQTIATWAYTQIVRKQGSQPTGPGDGTLVVKSSVRDQYQTTGYIDTNLTNDTLYYYGAFAYNSDGVYSEGAFVSATPRAGTPIGELAEGTLITITESGAPVEFYVADHNYQSDLNGDGRTLMVRKDCYNRRQWDSNQSEKDFLDSSIFSWLNSSYKALFSQSVKTMMSTTNFYYIVAAGTVYQQLSQGNSSVFLLSLAEMGFRESSPVTPVDGNTLPTSSVLAIANFSGTPKSWYLRTPYTGISDGVYYMNSQGGRASAAPNGTQICSRPCFTLPSTALVDTNNALIES